MKINDIRKILDIIESDYPEDVEIDDILTEYDDILVIIDGFDNNYYKDPKFEVLSSRSYSDQRNDE